MTKRVWVQPASPLKQALLAAGLSASEIELAMLEGRIFGKGHRLREINGMFEGEVTMASPRAQGPLWEPEIVLQTDDFVVVNKPSGMSTIGDLSGQTGTLRQWIEDRVGQGAHPTSRLDRPVSGLVTFALTARARELATDARKQHRYERDYLAIVVGGIREQVVWNFAIGKHRSNPMLRAVAPKGQQASTHVIPIAWNDNASLLRLQPVTGRTHQLRVHCAHAGHAIVGDVDYGGIARWVLPTGSIVSIKRVMLHCARVRIDLSRETIEANAPTPHDFGDAAKALGFETITLSAT